MISTARLAVLVLAAGTAGIAAMSGPLKAQDVRGIEACSQETKIERRTGCMQSNIEYLQQLIARNNAAANQRLAAAAAEIAALKASLAALQATVDKLAAGKQADAKPTDTKPADAKPAETKPAAGKAAAPK
ncbi:hypothetical protein [Rhodoplanes sp.]|uniref:hypothetical protein n=1 Tax=Rhodoplanes sp. TaxID=1968906 RepID=UPI0025CBBBA3|nr:hypothetical protein [Rhodoplanes sp.]